MAAITRSSKLKAQRQATSTRASLSSGITPQPSRRALKKASSISIFKRKPYTYTKKSHKELNKGFNDLGKALRARKLKQVIKNNFKLANHKDNFFTEEAAKVQSGKFEIGRFETKYRARLPGHDELFSTSSVREFLNGMIGDHHITPLSKTEVDSINSIIDFVSNVRFPTEYTGYALSGSDFLQHPTKSAKGIFHISQGSHSELDLERKSAVLKAMTDAAEYNTSTIEDIVKAGVKESIRFTLNVFSAPVTADNVSKFTRGRQRTSAMDQKQVDMREVIKNYGITLGLEVEKQTIINHSRTRKWISDRNRDLSPPRK